ncbi:MAG: binary toxin-like calcium binding domain-containing protein [Gelidibacter sp.]
MDQLKKLIGGLLIMGVLCVQAQVTNTGEMTALPGTQIVSLSHFSNTDTGTVNNNGDFQFYGDYNNEGNFSFLAPIGGTARFLGKNMQHLSGNGANNFYNVAFNNPSGPEAFKVNTAIRIVNNADFIQGIVKNNDLQGNFLFGPTASHTGTSMDSYVDGTVLKEGDSGFTFPIGDGGFYRNLSISETNASNTVFASRYKLENSNVDYPHNVYLGIIGFINDVEYWTLERTQGTGSVSLTLRWDSNTTPTELLSGDSSDIHIVRWDTVRSAWVAEGSVINIENQSVTTTSPLGNYGVFTLAKVSTDETDTDGDGVPDFVEINSLPPTDPTDPNDYTDTDGDGVPDYVENNTSPPSDPNNINDFTDRDGDGIPDYVEDFGVDTDGDGVPDFIELTGNPATDPNDPSDFADSDGDGVPDFVEANGIPKSDPNDPSDFADSDGDGVPDYVEINGQPATNPNDPNDFADSDGDGVPDYVEINSNPPTNPNDPKDFTDSDGDGVPDYVEINGNPATNPNDPKDFKDSDGDGVPDYVEINGQPATNPNDPNDFADSDGDGVPDYVEINSNPPTNPNDPKDFTDSDGDGVPDYVEINGNPATNPNDPSDFLDSDGDGVPDYVEINGEPATNPNDPSDFLDSDGDGVPDYVEINGNPATDPNDPADFADSDGDGISDYTEQRYIKDDLFIENDLVSKSKPGGFFEIVNIERFPDNTVEIFNRNGIMVFRIDGYDNYSKVFRGISDGKTTLQKGEGLPTGVYFYIIKYVRDAKSRSKSGYLYFNK